jgi:hypothetical protein
MIMAALRVLHLSRRERSDCIDRCDPGEGLRSIVGLHPLTRIATRTDLSPQGRGEAVLAAAFGSNS